MTNHTEYYDSDNSDYNIDYENNNHNNNNNMDDNSVLVEAMNGTTMEELNLIMLSPPNLDGRDESLAKIEILVLTIIFILAASGNGLMLFALRRQLHFRPMSRMYYFMLQLSLADLLVAFGNILPQLAWDITYRFKGNDFLCRSVKFLQVFVLYLSTFILTSMAIDRCMVVCYPTFSRNHYSGIKGPKTLILISWIISFALASPQALIFSFQQVEDGIYDCWVHFVTPWDKVYVTWFVIWAFILPLFIILISYGSICLKVARFNLPTTPNTALGSKSKYSSSSQTQHNTNSSIQCNGCQTGEANNLMMKPIVVSSLTNKTSDTTNVNKNTILGGRTGGKAGKGRKGSMDDSSSSTATSTARAKGIDERQLLKRQISAAKIKTLKLTLIIVISFVVCWTPFCVTQLIMVYNPPEPGTDVEPIKVILLLLASLNSCTNPWIYLFFSETLCNQLRMCLRIGFGRGSNEESIGDEQVMPAPAPKPKVKSRRIINELQQHQIHERINVHIIKHHDEDYDEGDDNVLPDTKSTNPLPKTTSEGKDNRYD